MQNSQNTDTSRFLSILPKRPVVIRQGHVPLAFRLRLRQFSNAASLCVVQMLYVSILVMSRHDCGC